MAEDWPKVWVLFLTHKRTNTALRTLDSLHKHLKYPNLHWHVGSDDGDGKTDDGTDRWHVGVLTEHIAQWYPEVTYHEIPTPPGKFNTGLNANTGIRAAQANGCQIYELNYDDWALFRDLDIRPMVDVLDHEPAVGFIRLSYHVPGHGLLTVRYDAPRMGVGAGYMWGRIIRNWSLENPYGDRDAYLVSTQPYVAHTRFHDAYGWHPENINPGLAEMGLSNQYIKSPLGENGPQILFPIGPITVHAPWEHSVGRANDYAKV
jgi:hypothetical protein